MRQQTINDQRFSLLATKNSFISQTQTSRLIFINMSNVDIVACCCWSNGIIICGLRVVCCYTLIIVCLRCTNRSLAGTKKYAFAVQKIWNETKMNSEPTNRSGPQPNSSMQTRIYCGPGQPIHSKDGCFSRLTMNDAPRLKKQIWSLYFRDSRCVRGLVSLLRCCYCWMSEICHFCFSVSSLAPLLFKQNSFEILANANRLEFRAIKNRFMWRFDSKGPHTLTHLQIFAVTGTAFFCHTLTGLPIE